MSQSNAQTALAAAALVHQRVAAAKAGGGTTSTTTNPTEFRSTDRQVTETADTFLAWLNDNDGL